MLLSTAEVSYAQGTGPTTPIPPPTQDGLAQLFAFLTLLQQLTSLLQALGGGGTGGTTTPPVGMMGPVVPPGGIPDDAPCNVWAPRLVDMGFAPLNLGDDILADGIPFPAAALITGSEDTRNKCLSGMVRGVSVFAVTVPVLPLQIMGVPPASQRFIPSVTLRASDTMMRGGCRKTFAELSETETFFCMSNSIITFVVGLQGQINSPMGPVPLGIAKDTTVMFQILNLSKQEIGFLLSLVCPPGVERTLGKCTIAAPQPQSMPEYFF